VTRSVRRSHQGECQNKHTTSRMAVLLRAWQTSCETKYNIHTLVVFAAQGRAWTSLVVLRMESFADMRRPIKAWQTLCESKRKVHTPGGFAAQGRAWSSHVVLRM